MSRSPQSPSGIIPQFFPAAVQVVGLQHIPNTALPCRTVGFMQRALQQLTFVAHCLPLGLQPSSDVTSRERPASARAPPAWRQAHLARGATCVSSRGVREERALVPPSGCAGASTVVGSASRGRGNNTLGTTRCDLGAIRIGQDRRYGSRRVPIGAREFGDLRAGDRGRTDDLVLGKHTL